MLVRKPRQAEQEEKPLEFPASEFPHMGGLKLWFRQPHPGAFLRRVQRMSRAARLTPEDLEETGGDKDLVAELARRRYEEENPHAEFDELLEEFVDRLSRWENYEEEDGEPVELNRETARELFVASHDVMVAFYGFLMAERVEALARLGNSNMGSGSIGGNSDGAETPPGGGSGGAEEKAA